MNYRRSPGTMIPVQVLHAVNTKQAQFLFQDPGIPHQVSQRAHFLSINWQIKWSRHRERRKMALLLAFYEAAWPVEQRTAVQGEERSLCICWLFQLSARLNAAARSFRKGKEALLKGPANTPPLLVYIYTNPIFLSNSSRKSLFHSMI